MTFYYYVYTLRAFQEQNNVNTYEYRSQIYFIGIITGGSMRED